MYRPSVRLLTAWSRAQVPREPCLSCLTIASRPEKIPPHCMRGNKGRISIFLRDLHSGFFPEPNYPFFNTINFRRKKYSGNNGKWWVAGNDGFIFTLE